MSENALTLVERQMLGPHWMWRDRWPTPALVGTIKVLEAPERRGLLSELMNNELQSTLTVNEILRAITVGTALATMICNEFGCADIGRDGTRPSAVLMKPFENVG